ncbi:Enoyl-CoA hydratase carnithine racemase [Paucilactobacillus oligofermentans DSM 15707 = LMG 22743]|uniref:Enoyl-CoA hydratase carnithine racemase n=1 Tax=Paucilactobacillus oligofermentans DSM 15707 = LMG 22743 TaxID=1423778 RepID=A0A0R1RNG0_9LACO|nr:enoyl-CoA hydratase-related protein [Paucilactobacillus oligofermentans]KRL57742.1 Enoyl-CoA hydratase carnithine racemase [Paucilactobacillus oligofermentans DSM 15707 = LMG 22743]CUS26808.1 Short-chain-enoyl-CoA hydratase [Paucilactobacillus oligofermentans DSM 15707 = LMG 22743]
MKEYNNLLFTVEDGIGVLTINRPKSLNALNSETLAEIGSALSEIKTNKDVKVLIITGSGQKAFVAGADISQMAAMNPIEAAELSELAHNAFQTIESLPQMTIAAVNGYCLGGGFELANSCDIRIAASTAKFGQPEVGLGIVPGFGGTQRLTRLVGRGKAKEIITTGAQITATEAKEIGAVEEVVELDQLMTKVNEIASKIIKNGPVAVRMAKYVIDKGADLELNTAISFETQMWAQTFATEDQKEGMAAFLEKRHAKFSGK